jgi:hypothetical protein
MQGTGGASHPGFNWMDHPPMAAPAEQDATRCGMARTPDLLAVASGVCSASLARHVRRHFPGNPSLEGPRWGLIGPRINLPREEKEDGSPINSFP